MSYDPIDIDFDIEIDAETAFDIFGGTTTVPGEIIDASYNIPVNAFYDASNNKGLIEFWEPLANPNSLICQLANSSTGSGQDFTDAYKVTARRLVKQFQKVLVDSFDCSAAAPFDDVKYRVGGVISGAQVEGYYRQPHFGRVALASLAHSIFNHIDATGAISNDKEFMARMLSIPDASAGTTVDEQPASDRYSAYIAGLTALGANNPLGDLSSNIVAWPEEGDATDAKLSVALTRALMMKGLDASGNITQQDLADGSANLRGILSQVIGQNSVRLQGQDNNARVPDVHQLLPFVEGDKIYVNIRVMDPTVYISGVAQTLPNVYTPKSYKLKITLTAPDANIDA